MSELVAFLKARYDEDERTARAAAAKLRGYADSSGCDSSASWQASEALYVDGASHPFATGVYGDLDEEVAEHIARHDPKRVLTEIEAKRRIVELHGDQHDDGDPRSYEVPYTGCETLRLLAAPHADHPDYRQEWAPA